MLFFMGAASHYGAMVHNRIPAHFTGCWSLSLSAAVEANALVGTQGATKKPLDSVNGALWFGFLLDRYFFLVNARAHLERSLYFAR